LLYRSSSDPTPAEAEPTVNLIDSPIASSSGDAESDVASLDIRKQTPAFAQAKRGGAKYLCAKPSLHPTLAANCIELSFSNEPVSPGVLMSYVEFFYIFYQPSQAGP
jgi:hypothetical protein